MTDPLEVDRIAGICQQGNPKSSTTAFRQVFQQLAAEPDSAPRPSSLELGGRAAASDIAGRKNMREDAKSQIADLRSRSQISNLRSARAERSVRRAVAGRVLLLALAFVLLGTLARAPPVPTTPASKPLALNVPQDLSGGPEKWTSPEGLSSTIQVMLLLTVLSLAPAILLMTTCFVRVVVVLSLLRQALGTQQLPPNQVITSLAMFITLVIMAPELEAGLRRSRSCPTRTTRSAGRRPGRAARRRSASS